MNVNNGNCMTNLAVEYLETAKLIPYLNNARTHSDKQITQIAASIREFGFTNPILIDRLNTIIAGHGRLMAAKKLELESVPVIRIEHLTKAQQKAYVLADNQLALNAGWDEQLLKLELGGLKEMEFDLDLLGFDASQLNFSDLDYGIIDGEDLEADLDDMNKGVRKAIQIEFELEYYDEAVELVKFWRSHGGNVGMMLLNHLKDEKSKL